MTERLVIAFSGGADSVCALYKIAAKYPGIRLIIAHFNHGISDKSDEWERLGKKYARHFGAEFVCARDNLKECEGNLENIAREKRYTFFNSLMKEESLLVTGHHMDDQLETVLMKLFRGSGVDGLGGMDECLTLKKGYLIRPLLKMTKSDIYDFCKEHAEFGWVEDDSNSDSSYDRNYLRNEVIPLIKKRWPKAAENTSKSAENIRNTKDLLTRATYEKYSAARFSYFGLAGLKIDELKKHSYDLQSFFLKQLISSEWFHTNSTIIKQTLKNVVNSTDLGSQYNTGDYILQKDRIAFDGVAQDVLILLPSNYFSGTKDLISFGDFSLKASDYRIGEFLYVPKSTKIKVNFKTKKIRDIYSDKNVPLFLRDKLPIHFSYDGTHIIIPSPSIKGGCSLIKYTAE